MLVPRDGARREAGSGGSRLVFSPPPLHTRRLMNEDEGMYSSLLLLLLGCERGG